MLSFLAENWGTLLVCAILLVCVALIIKKLVKDRKRASPPVAAAAIAANATAVTMLKTQKIILNPILFFHLLLTIYSLKGVVKNVQSA